MEYIIGVVLAILVSLGATFVGFDRDRAMYPVMIVVIALLYALFAVIGHSLDALGWEALPIALFVAAAVLGFRRSLWWAVFGLAAHGVFDFIHPALIDNPGVPAWWPMFCASYDLVAAAYLAWLLRSGRLAAAAAADIAHDADGLASLRSLPRSRTPAAPQPATPAGISGRNFS